MSRELIGKIAVAAGEANAARELLLCQLQNLAEQIKQTLGAVISYGASKEVYVEEWEDQEEELAGGVVAFLSYNAHGLWVSHALVPEQFGEFSMCTIASVDSAWLGRLAQQDVIDSLLTSIGQNVKARTAALSDALTEISAYLDQEMALLDTDLTDQQAALEAHPGDWMKARSEALTDPSNSVTRSCAHLETVMKRCLLELGSGAETDIEKRTAANLSRDLCRKLRESLPFKEGLQDLLQGADRAVKAIGVLRNQYGSAHGPSSSRQRVTVAEAQAANRIAGALAALFVDLTQQTKDHPGGVS